MGAKGKRGSGETMMEHVARGVALLDLRSCQCRYPILVDPSVPGGHRFCAEATSPDRVYCARHHSIATTVWARRTGKSFVSTYQGRAA